MFCLSILIGTLIMISSGCKKEEDMPSVTTVDVSSLGQTSVSCGGTITSEGGSTVISRGVCWGTNATPKITDSKTSDGAGAGSFTSAITGLSAGTKYFVRAYATNGKGTGYGMAMSFTTTPATAPSLTTANVTAITLISAICGGTIGDDGAASITARGVCWSTAINPTIADNKTSDGTGTGTFVSTLTGLTGNTEYWIRAYATNSAGTSYGDLVEFMTSPLVPTLSTISITSITNTTAVSGGNITKNGGATITASGVCWSVSPGPTIINSKTIGSTGYGIYSNNLTGLVAGTKYYVRAYATNSVGTAYGNEFSFVTNGAAGTVTDIDGNSYSTIKIGTQVWMAENLKTTKYNDGTTMSIINDYTIWTALTTPAYCWYDNGVINKPIYGALYNWYTVNPIGNGGKNWHIPTDAEWTILTTYLGNDDNTGNKLKEIGTIHWISQYQGTTNETGFTALPGGDRTNTGTYTLIRQSGLWWSSSEYSTTLAQYRFMSSTQGKVFGGNSPKQYGMSVRCLKD
jgi:uncharacterized protein (TIGR02145 family)